MRIIAKLVVVTGLAVILTGCGASNSTVKPTQSSVATASSSSTNAPVSLPDWSSDAPGDYAGKVFMPKNARVVKLLTGSNADAGAPTDYSIGDLGNGMQVRYACGDTKVDETASYFNVKVGRDTSNYENTPGPQRTGSFFFNWDWLSIGQGAGGFIDVWGACSWEIRILAFPVQSPPAG